jgi:hypothetical protein
MIQRLPSGSGKGTLQGSSGQYPGEMAPLLDGPAHITDWSGRRLGGSRRLGYGRLRDRLANEGSRRFVDQ